MKLPGGDAAMIEIVKIREYCLSARHARGKHKARVFQAALGLSADDAEELQLALAEAARNGNAEIGDSDSYGTRYIIDFELRREARTARIRSCWIVLSGETSPRFVTCFVL